MCTGALIVAWDETERAGRGRAVSGLMDVVVEPGLEERAVLL